MLLRNRPGRLKRFFGASGHDLAGLLIRFRYPATGMRFLLFRDRSRPADGGSLKVLAFFGLLAASVLRCLGAGDFEFVVIGDTRPHFESENFRTFENLIPAINRLQPALVVNLGDLIFGYGPRSKEKQWDKYQQVIKAIQVPYYQVPGNHDTHSAEARKIYGRRFGKFYQSFDFNDCHFVLLDNTEAGRWGHLAPAELEWLKSDLKQTKARSVFVFLHFPVWEPERLDPRCYQAWVQTLHPLFKESRVRAVFGGHFHAYGPTREFDGIRYFITGGGGAELLPEYKKAGGEHHFLKVKVSGDTLDVRVVTGHGELSDAEADLMGGFLFAEKHSSRVGLDLAAQDLKGGVTFSFSVQNPYPEPLAGKAEWVLDASAFSVEPPTIPVKVAPGGTGIYPFALRAFKEATALQSFPRLQFDVSSGGRRHRFHRDVLLLQQVATAYRRAAPALDGQLIDWDGVPQVHLGQGSKRDPQLRTCYDGENLYLAVTVPAIPAATEQEFGLADDLQLGMARPLNATDFGGDFIRLGFSSKALGARNRMPGTGAGTTVPGVQSACATEGDRTSYEIAVPFRLLKHLRTGGQRRLILNLSFPVPDTATDEEAEPALNSFSYQVRYGSGSLVPVRFVELTLEPKR